MNTLYQGFGGDQIWHDSGAGYNYKRAPINKLFDVFKLGKKPRNPFPSLILMDISWFAPGVFGSAPVQAGAKQIWLRLRPFANSGFGSDLTLILAPASILRLFFLSAIGSDK